MRTRLLLAKWGLLLGTGTATAQLPRIPEAPPILPTIPQAPPLPRTPGTYNPVLPGPIAPPNRLPPLNPAMPVPPGQPGLNAPGVPGYPPPGATIANPVAQPQEIKLPQPEQKFSLNVNDVTLKRISGGWQLWAGQRMVRDFGDREMDARNALRVFKDLRPTEWASIGGAKPVVEYALVNGRPPATLGLSPADDSKNPNGGPGGGGIIAGPAVTGAGANTVVPIDLRTVRVEAVRGVWCLRDDANIHFNFGPVKDDAEQALGVVRRYGFNRIGIVGTPNPVMTYFFVGQDDAKQFDRGPFAQAALQAQIDGLNRVGIPVPGVGYVGEMVRLDPRKLEVKKDGTDWVVTTSTDVIGRFGPTEWVAKDAARTIADGRFTEFCKVGSAGLTFFLVHGKAPARVPFAVQGRRFDPGALKVRQVGGGWAVTENGRHLFDCATAEEGETLIRVVRHFKFDQLCHLGPSRNVGVTFLAKGQ